MTKSEIIKQASYETRIPQTKIRTIFDTVESIIIENLINGEEVKIMDLGTFYVAERAKRTYAHPQDSSIEIEVPARKKLKFRPCGSLATAINKTIDSDDN
jgi:nucleoid DNA-binding protein